MSRANHFSFGGLIFPSCITVYFGTKTFYGNCKFRHETVKLIFYFVTMTFYSLLQSHDEIYTCPENVLVPK